MGAGFFLKQEFMDWWIKRKFSKLSADAKGFEKIKIEIEGLQVSRQAVVNARAAFDAEFSDQKEKEDLPFDRLEQVLFRLEDLQPDKGTRKIFTFSEKIKSAH